MGEINTTSITCPSCGVTKSIPNEKHPKQPVSITCRPCNGTFGFDPNVATVGVVTNIQGFEEVSHINKSNDNAEQGSSFTMTVRGQSGVLDGLGTIVLGVFLLFFASHRILFLIAAASVLFIGLVLLLRSLPRIGKPILVLSYVGFKTPDYGLIPWSAVQGVDKRIPTARGVKMSPVLMFYVPGLEKYKNQFKGIIRHLFYRKNTVHITLRNSDVTLEAAATASRHLWTEHTGRDHYWSFNSSKEGNESMRRISEKMKQESALFDDISKAAADRDDYKVAYMLRKNELNKTDLQSDMDIIDADRKKTLKRANCVLVIGLLFFVAYVVLEVMHFLRY